MTNVLQIFNINLNIIVFEKLNLKEIKNIARIFQNKWSFKGAWLDLYIVMDI